MAIRNKNSSFLGGGIFIIVGLILLSILFEPAATASKFMLHHKRSGAERTFGNRCPESMPWPCKTDNFCLSFDFICDGESDCPDSYDEDPNLCTAKDRPAMEVLSQFIDNNHEWLVPSFLGSGTNDQLALALIETKSLAQYAEKMNLSPEQTENLRKLMEAIKFGRQMELLIMGMPAESWNELYFLFKRIIDTGFLPN